MLKTKLDESTQFEIRPENPLYNSYGNLRFKSNNIINVYTEDIVRRLLNADLATEDAFRSLEIGKEFVPSFGMSNESCDRLMTLKKLIAKFPDYETGILEVSKLFYPQIRTDFEMEGVTHVNVSKDSKSQLGAGLWDLVTEKYRIDPDGPFVSLSQIIGTGTLSNYPRIFPAIYKNGILVRNEETFANHLGKRLSLNEDIDELIYHNKLPITIYRTEFIKGKKRHIYNVDDFWFTEKIESMSKENSR